MDNLLYKLKFIYSRYLIIALGSIIGFSSLNIYFFQTQLIPLEDFFYEFLMPLLLPVIPLIFWLRPCRKLLKLEQKNGRDLFNLYVLLAYFAILFPFFLSQKYIRDAVGKLTKLPSINQIDKSHLTKFYHISHIYLDKAHSNIRFVSKVSGKNNANLTFTAYVAVPIFENPIPPPLWPSLPTRESTHGDGPLLSNIPLNYFVPKAWLGWQRSLRIRNRQSDAVKDSVFRSFIKETYLNFKNDKIYGFDYLQKAGLSKENENFNLGIRNVYYAKKPIILIPKYNLFQKRGDVYLLWTILSFCIGSIIWFLILIPVKLKEDKLAS